MATRMCRVGFLVKDMEAFATRFRDIFGVDLHNIEIGDVPLKVMIGDSGFEPMQSLGLTFGPIEGPFIEVGLAVPDAEACTAALRAAGYEPVTVVPLLVAQSHEYLFGPDFHGIPVMVSREGDLEIEQALQVLEDAPSPKLGCCSLLVDDLDRAAADFTRFYDMAFAAADPAGLGRRALVGRHRVKLVERGATALSGEFRGPLAAIELIYDDVEAQRAKLEAAGLKVLHRRTLKSGGQAYYFGAQFENLPFGIYAAADDDEMRGGAG